MVDQPTIRLLIDDRSVLRALRFSLSIEGFSVKEDTTSPDEAVHDEILVIDECFAGDGLQFLAGLRSGNCRAPVMILATNPTIRIRNRIRALNAILIEKPLLGDELSRAILSANQTREAA